MSWANAGERLELLRVVLDAYQRMRSVVEGMRAEATNVDELLGIAAVADEVDEAIARHKIKIARLEAAQRGQLRRMPNAQVRA